MGTVREVVMRYARCGSDVFFYVSTKYGWIYMYLLGAVLSAVSVLSKIDRPRRPRPQSAHRATAAPMLRAYVDRGLGAVPARYR